MKNNRPQFFYAEDAGGGDGGTAVVEQHVAPNMDDNPFARAMKTDIGEEGLGAPAPEPKKEVAVKVETVVETKSDVPRDLFKKGDLGKAAEKAPTPSELDAIKPPDGISEANLKGWDALKEKAHAFEAKARELESKYGERDKGFTAIEKELQEARAKIAEMDGLVERAHVEAHPTFQKMLNERTSIVSRVEALIRDNEGDPSDVAAALALKGAARNKAMAAFADVLPGFQQGILGQYIQQLDTVDGGIEEARGKSSEYLKNVQAEQSKAELAQRETWLKQRNTSFDEALRESKTQWEVFQEVAGFDEWSKRAPELMKAARDKYENNSNFKDDAATYLAAEAAPVYRDLFVKADERAAAAEKKNAELEAELKKLHGGGPRISSTPSGSSQPKNDRGDWEQRLKEMTGMSR